MVDCSLVYLGTPVYQCHRAFSVVRTFYFVVSIRKFVTFQICNGWLGVYSCVVWMLVNECIFISWKLLTFL